jgi:hypothetical protein
MPEKWHSTILNAPTFTHWILSRYHISNRRLPNSMPDFVSHISTYPVGQRVGPSKRRFCLKMLIPLAYQPCSNAICTHHVTILEKCVLKGYTMVMTDMSLNDPGPRTHGPDKNTTEKMALTTANACGRVSTCWAATLLNVEAPAATTPAQRVRLVSALAETPCSLSLQFSEP